MRLLLCSFVGFVACAAVHAATTSYICQFPVEASPKGLANQAKPFELRYVVDASTKKAYLLGNAGSSRSRSFQTLTAPPLSR